MTVILQLTKSTLCSAEYKIDVPNIAFRPKISCECMGWRPTGHVARGAWIMFPGMALHWSRVIICAYHMTHVRPIMIAYFG